MAVKERSNNQWLAALRGPNRDEALADLRVLLMCGLRGALGGQANRADSSVEDFAQEALIKILGNLDSFRGECRFTTWAHKICVRTAFAEMRRSRWREVSLDEVMTQQPEESAAADPQLDPERAATQTMIVEKFRPPTRRGEPQTPFSRLSEPICARSCKRTSRNAPSRRSVNSPPEAASALGHQPRQDHRRRDQDSRGSEDASPKQVAEYPQQYAGCGH